MFIYTLRHKPGAFNSGLAKVCIVKRSVGLGHWWKAFITSDQIAI